MLTDVRPLNVNSYENLISSGIGSGRLYVNVEPNMVMYTQYKHVSGVAAKKTEPTVPISKLQIVNALIDRLTEIKKITETKNQELDIPANLGSLDDDHLDIIIDDLQYKIDTAAQIAQANPFAQVTVEMGQFVNFVA